MSNRLVDLCPFGRAAGVLFVCSVVFSGPELLWYGVVAPFI